MRVFNFSIASAFIIPLYEESKSDSKTSPIFHTKIYKHKNNSKVRKLALGPLYAKGD